MSSVVSFVRALVMLTCVLVVLVLAISHGEAISRAVQAAGRCLERAASGRSVGNDDSPQLAEPVVGAGRTQPAAASLLVGQVGPADPSMDRPLRPLPEPVDDLAAERRFTPALAPSSAPDTLQQGGPVVEEASAPQISQEAPSSVAGWQERASILQQLGAVEYALEKWGKAGELYRFRCLVALAGSRSYRKHFQAIDRDGGRAVERVLEQVGSWRARLSSVQ